VRVDFVTANFLELRYSEVRIAPSARCGGPTTGGAKYVLWMLSVSYVRQLPVRLYLEHEKRSEPGNFTYPHMGQRTI
jgi:hypothetical protein